jgi:hypothetical protein
MILLYLHLYQNRDHASISKTQSQLEKIYQPILSQPSMYYNLFFDNFSPL